MINLIAAIGPNNAIGKNGRLPWRLPEDLKRFKELTMGHPIIMGRKTFESIGRPLPGRTNIIITRQDDYQAPGCLIAHSLAEALRKAEGDPFIIGGAEIYRQALPQADFLYLTEVKIPAEGDTFFPEFERKEWEETKREEYDDFDFVTLKRKK